MSLLDFLLPRRDGDEPTLWADLREGRAGWLVRLVLSIASAPLALVPMMAGLGLVEATGRHVRGEHIAIGVAVAGVLWCGVCIWIWAGQRRWRRVVQTSMVVVGIWVVTIALASVCAEVARSEFLTAACILTGIGSTIFIVATAAYRRARGKPIADRLGAVRVNCPDCGYSMVGLETCTCPECGAGFTLDQIILAQQYGAVRHDGAAETEGDETPAGDGDTAVQGERLPEFPQL